MGEQLNKEEIKKDEKVENHKPEEKTESLTSSPQPPPPLVLQIDLHCVGCAKKIEKILLKMKGIEGVMIDMANNQVTLKGLVEPEAVCNRIMKKTKRMAKVLSSPLPEAAAAAAEPVPQVIASESTTEQTNVELDVNMHCQACADQLKKKLLKMKGVQKVEIELKSSKVTVFGTMDSKQLVNYVYQRTKKQAKIVPQLEPAPVEKKKNDSDDQSKAKEEKSDDTKHDEPSGKEEEKKIEDVKTEEMMIKEGMEHYEVMNLEEEHMKKMYYFYPLQQQSLYVVERLPPPAPQIFSDENPNACTIC